MGGGSRGTVGLCSPNNQVGHAGGGAKSLHITPILDQWVSTEAGKGFAFTSARPHAHLVTWILVSLGCMLQPSCRILGPWLRGAVFTTWAKSPPLPPHESGTPWYLHFTDPEKSDSSIVMNKSGPVGCHPLSKRQPGLGWPRSVRDTVHILGVRAGDHDRCTLWTVYLATSC